MIVCGPSDAAIHSVRDYGAKGDRSANDRAAIQSAIDACAKAGGGTVIVPAGDYLTGKIRLRSHITLQIEPGATLWQSGERADYDGPGGNNLLVADGAEHIALVGEGRIHGTGEVELGRRRGVKWVMPDFRTGILLFDNCRNVHIRGVTILMSDAWTVHLRRCQTVFIDGLTIHNNYYRTNSDGIDPNMCRDVHISNCHIVAGDDCIVLKATEAEPCENVVVTNCTLETIATALKLGTESRGDFRDIHFSNCVIRNSTVGIGFFMKDGATMERVTFSNISIENPTTSPEAIVPIFMDIERRNPDSKIGRIRDVSFSDISIRSGMGVIVQGMPESPIENLMFDNITFRVENPRDYSSRRKHVGGNRTTKDERDTLYVRQPSYFTVAHVKGLILEDLRVFISPDDFAKFPRSAFSGHAIEGGVLRNISRTPAATESERPAIVLENCRDIVTPAVSR